MEIIERKNEMAEVKKIRSEAREFGAQVEEWQPGPRERTIETLRVFISHNPRGLEMEQVRVEINASERGADTSPAEPVTFYLPISALVEAVSIINAEWLRSRHN